MINTNNKWKESEEREIEVIYDSRKSFYGKAQETTVEYGNIYGYMLYSYEQPAAFISVSGKLIQNAGIRWSRTTGRHFKEFRKQHNAENIKPVETLNIYESIRELAKEGGAE